LMDRYCCIIGDNLSFLAIKWFAPLRKNPNYIIAKNIKKEQ